MCFYGNINELKIAQEDVYCLKSMELVFINGEYRLNSQIYPSKRGYAVGDEITARDLTDDEFADFVNKFKREHKGSDAIVALNGEMVHSFDYTIESYDCIVENLTDFIPSNPFYISVACVIPKGTPYIINKGHGIASRKVVIKGVLCTTIFDNDN